MSDADPGFDWDPDRYPAQMAEEIPGYDELQGQLVDACDAEPARILELGVGTGETARRLLARHPGAALVGLDSSPAMLRRAGERLGAAVELVEGRLEDALPPGPFDLVVAALVVHHLDGPGKADLFGRIRDALVPGGRFVLADLVVPDDPADVVTEIDGVYDRPSTAGDQLRWLAEAGLHGRLRWSRGDLAVLVADRP